MTALTAALLAVVAARELYRMLDRIRQQPPSDRGRRRAARHVNDPWRAWRGRP